MKKQSSIDWLEQQLNAFREQGNIEIENLIWQAKLMHKEEIMNAYLDGDSNGCGCYDYSTEEDAKKYYNSTDFIKNEEDAREQK